MTISVFLGIWNEEKLRRVKVEDLDLESNVEILKPYLTRELGDQVSDSFELTFCGLLLDDKKPLTSYGVTSGVTIHVIEKPKPKEVNKVDFPKITEAVIQDFVSSYRSFRASPSFRSTLHRLENPAELDKVTAAVPGLKSDPIAVAFISKPDLFTQMEDPQTCWQIAERNPVILVAARYIITEFHKTTSSSSPAIHPAPSSGHSYSLDALSDDDDEMEGDGPSSGAITAAQLSAALAAASAAPASRITPEMLQQALSPSGAGGTSRYTSQLRQMRELGLNDEGRNLRALTAAAGDLQGAIDLVFSGALDD